MKNKNEITIEADSNNITINIPVELLVFTQENRDFPYRILNLSQMTESFKNDFVFFDADEEGNSSFTRAVDKFFDYAYEFGEDWLEEKIEWQV